MAPKSIRKAISDAFDGLVDEDLERFCFQLLDRKGKRVPESWVMGKSRARITAVLVRTYTEKGALKVVLESLRELGFNQNAKELVEATKHLTSSTPNAKRKNKARGASGAASSEPDRAGDEHFIDKHRNELIDRVSNIDGILDDLLQAGVIKQEMYDKIRARSTTQDMMRDLYSGPLKAGEASKDILYNSLKKNEKYLMNDLKKK
ncbi:apoptosis-associated speck-like protein containing a CARD [Sphaeramia orbicularis]|uniref:Apoptosis-associated speck-like protein containing a CARD n=1 Tax=Sphaeramia orbicularis TaxID=375764 RepID=A0A673A1N2_9TELE|nr:apoptosis-associated speck-like protein containing a CARD [Sphaeramia orbicularis]